VSFIEDAFPYKNKRELDGVDEELTGW